ncbi:MAG: flagellar biosynthesis protein FlhB [Peptococcaceae bacterium]|jgi:flagellar biosynthetic protein FlhB|nr:flagellar biosynthesis protein FlhB [Peptococcaceae bacterium]MDH7524053.1 flagellar biosynthesis protein FlhB [Peptococcaceae bacterium]
MSSLRLNLQLFAGEKTERATPRRREEARKKGQVARSNEIVTVTVLALTLLLLQVWFPAMARDFQKFFYHIFSYSSADLTVERAEAMVLETVLVMAKMAGPVLLVALAAGLVSNVVQVGFLLTAEPLKFDLNRLNPARGFQRIFSKRAVIELVKSVLKTLLVGYVALSFLRKQLPGLSVLMGFPVESSLAYLGDITFAVSWRILLVLFILALGDYAYQVYEYEQSLKMSKQEVKEEYKTIEGDPQLRARIRERQRQLAARRMMQEVPRATVVITNPAHVAVALKYEEEMNAPVVVAKGQDHLAARIKEIASAHGVTVVENKTLAWILYKRVEINMAIPADLYQAVAEVIAHVYRLKKRY